MQERSLYRWFFAAGNPPIKVLTTRDEVVIIAS